MFDSSFIEIAEHISGQQFASINFPPSTFFMKIEEVPNFIMSDPRSTLDFFSIVTHNGDLPVTDALVDFVSKRRGFKTWHGQNIECRRNNVYSIPIGLENDHHFTHVGKRSQIYEASKRAARVVPTRMAYMNFSFWTRRDERTHLRNVLRGQKFVTDDCVESVVQENYSSWINKVLDHQYVLCPRGNGIDTHRLWETLYLGRIPIVKREINTDFYSDLPILVVDSWDEVTENLLEKNLKRLSDMNNFNLDMLKFSYWKNKIESEAAR